MSHLSERFRLPAKVMADETLAEFNGVLEVVLPKEKSKKPHKVEVKGE